MAKQSWEKFLTKEQYYGSPKEPGVGLTYPGRVLADYWTKYLPKMCQKMKDEGTLFQTLDEEGIRLSDLQCDLMQQGMSEDMAWEVVKEQIYSLPPEK